MLHFALLYRERWFSGSIQCFLYSCCCWFLIGVCVCLCVCFSAFHLAMSICIAIAIIQTQKPEYKLNLIPMQAYLPLKRFTQEINRNIQNINDDDGSSSNCEYLILLISTTKSVQCVLHCIKTNVVLISFINKITELILDLSDGIGRTQSYIFEHC